MKCTLEVIFEKYSKDFDGVGDEINLETRDIEVNNRHLIEIYDKRDTGKIRRVQHVGQESLDDIKEEKEDELLDSSYDEKDDKDELLSDSYDNKDELLGSSYDKKDEEDELLSSSYDKENNEEDKDKVTRYDKIEEDDRILRGFT